MNRTYLKAAAIRLALCLAVGCATQPLRTATYKGWDGYVLENDVARLHVVPDIGGRVIQYSLGGKDFFWVNPALTGKTSPETGLDPDDAWMNYGGDKLWPAPQGWDNDEQWPGPPDAVLDGQPHSAVADLESGTIHLTSRDDPRSGIRFSRNIRLHPNSTRVSFEATMTNIDTKPRRWGIWAHTQLDAGLPGGDNCNTLMRAWCPINPKSSFKNGYSLIFGEKDNPSFKVDAKRGLMQVSYHYMVGKIGLDSDAGWVATVDGRNGDVFVQRFKFEPGAAYPEGSSVEFWHNGLGQIYAYNKTIEMPDNRADNPYVFESEVLSPYAKLKPGESYTWQYEWNACRIGGDFPVIGCNEAGVVAIPFSCEGTGTQARVTGRFGVFHLGRVDLELSDAKGELLASQLIERSATPHKPVVIDHEFELPDGALRATLVLTGADGKRIGELAHVSLPK